MEFRWNDDGSLTLKEVTPIFTKHPRDGTLYYRTNLHANRNFQTADFSEIDNAVKARQKEPIGHFLDNGEMLTEQETETIVGLYDQIELAWQWQDGDLAIADNLKVVHGRNPFKGPREVLVCLLK
jgi:alpha-ketoglutarate-dependent taurine dioxygenase